MIEDKCCDNCEPDEITKLREKMPDEDNFFELAEFFKMFGDSTRIKIICALFNGELCVGGIVDLLEMSQSSISHQLRVLKSNRLVKSRKEGKQVFYSLDDMHVKYIFEMGLEHVGERK